MATPVVLLHGFAGTARHWDRVVAAMPPGRFVPLALELADAHPTAPDGVARLVASRAPDRFVLAGYSMGGRVALHVALALGERVSRLVLVSAGAGIEDPAARAQRRAADEALAREIERDGVERFVERWRAVPLFAGDPAWLAADVAVDERRCSASTLAASLRGLGPGAMTPMWRRLDELGMPVAVLAGARDQRYVAEGRRLADAIRDATLEVVPGAGHRVALEAPAAVVGALG
jgi:2-succinyl-6-hydroxy-2,4-cyclohexadiene-1-carboxylate synthase